MAGRITPGPSANGLDDNFAASFVLAADGKPALAIVNPDGSTVGGGGGGGAVTIADGANVTQGAIADATVAAGAAGTISAKLRRLTTDLAATQAAPGAALPASARLFGMQGNGGLLQTVRSAQNLGPTNVGADFAVATSFYVYNGTNMDQARSAVNATNSTGAGIQAAGLLAQFDDTSPTTITENQFGNLRMSANRNLYGTIRDAAGNERGVNVTAGNALVVDNSAVNQSVVGNVASGATDSGNPVKIGAVYNTSAPTPSNGQRVDLQADSQGNLKTTSAPLLYTTDSIASYSAALEVTFTTTTVQSVGTTDAQNFRSVSVQITGQGGSSTVNFETSENNVNWVACFLRPASTNTIPVSSATTTGIWEGNLKARFFRLNVTGIVSGTTLGVIDFFANPTSNDLTPAIGAISSGSPVNVVFVGMGDSGGNSQGIKSALANVTGATGNTTFSVGPAGYNGSTFDTLRMPAIFKTATATASGDTALWTPTSGKKFRLMRYTIQMTGDAATAGGADIDIVLRDSTTATAATFSVFVPAVAATTFGNTASSGWVDLGNGILSATTNNVLNINLSAALTSGKVRVIATGTEE